MGLVSGGGGGGGCRTGEAGDQVTGILSRWKHETLAGALTFICTKGTTTGLDLVLAECSAASTVDNMDVEPVVDLLKGHLQASAESKAMSAGEQNRARCQPWLARARCPLVLQAGLGLAHGH